MNYGILLAGGSGSRTGLLRPKQFEAAGGFYMITHAAKPLLSCKSMDAVCIVADVDWREKILEDFKKAELPTEKICCFADPGENRQLSILSGMDAILTIAEIEPAETGVTKTEPMGTAPTDADTVLIHDAARPFLSDQLLSAIYDALPGHDGVMPVLSMKDTVYLSEDKKSITRLLERDKIYAGQAPELFRFHAYYRANRALLPHRIQTINGAAEPAVMFGMEIAMIPGDERNFKVTTASDVDTYRTRMER